MKIIETVSDIGQVKGGGVLTIGNFDGVHIGHQKILSAARRIADERGQELVLMTFEPHPLAVLHPEKSPAILTPRALKRHLLEEMDVDVRLVLSCGAEVFSMSAEEFVRRFLVEGVRPCVVIEGEDFNFGAGRDGNVEMLERLGAESGFEVEVVGAEKISLPDGETVRVSSTMVRYMLEGGKVSDAAAALGRYYRLVGKVVKGRGVGRQLGFATANMERGEQLVPAEGVYAGFVSVADDVEGVCAAKDGVEAVFSIGQARTFGEDHPLLIEAHFLSDDVGELAGEFMAMDFVERLRSQFKFESKDDLIRQIGKDCDRVKEILSSKI